MAVNFTNITTWGGFINAPNANTGDWFWTATFYLFYFVMIAILTLSAGLESALIIGSLAGIFIGLLMAFAGMISLWVVGSMVGVELFLIIYIYYNSNRS